MQFSTPIALLLLLLLPVFWYIGFPRVSYRRQRDIASLIIRSLIIICVVLALAGAQIVQEVDKLAVVFLVDASDSVGQEIRDQQLEYIQSAIAEKPLEDEWAVVVFGADTSREVALTNINELQGIESQITATHTDIANAINIAIGSFEGDTARRIVILTDGQETLGNAEARAQYAAANGIEISYVPFFPEPLPDVRILDLDAPSRVNENQSFDIALNIEAEEATPATVRIFSEGRIIHEEDVLLQPGETNYTLSQVSDASGFLDFSAQLILPDGTDRFIQNNQLATFSQVIGPERVLLVSSDPAEVTNLLPALEQAGLIVDSIQPGSLPSDISNIANYKSVVLANIPANDLSTDQMELLETYVRDIGGGLVVIGGPDSYAPGGYFETPIEDALPVEMRIRDQQRIPEMALVYLIDRSGSMGRMGPNGVPNIELAKEAIIRSIDFLQPTDRAAIAGFDAGGAYIAQFQQVLNRLELQQFVAQLRSGGGTSILAGMELVAPDIVEEESDRKHIILLTDGGSSQTGLIELTEELYLNNGVTLSAIAIGQGAAPFLQEMANAGGGNYHEVVNVAQIPTIFTQETALASRSYILEEEFNPLLTANSPIMNGIDSAPALQGYVASTPKTTAQVVLSSGDPFTDPILATWQYGLGRAVAFTSDATGRWASDWVNWDDFSQFWGQVVNWTIAEGLDTNLESQVILQDETARVLVNARTNEGGFLNNLDLQTSVLSPDGTAENISLQQIAPGLYEGSFIPEEEGAYFLAVNGGSAADDDSIFNQVNGWVMSYSPEYRTGAHDETLLARLAEITGGQSMVDAPELVFEHNLGGQTTATPIWQWFLVIALLLLPFDIAVRRLIVTRGDLIRFQNWAFNRGEDDERSERMSSLISARERSREKTGYGSSAMTTPVSNPEETPRPTATPGSTPQPADTSGNIGSRLLKRRKPSADDSGE